MHIKPVILILSMALATGAQAQSFAEGRAAMKNMAEDLGVSRQELSGCMRQLTPPAERGNPTDEERSANEDKLVVCLQEVDSDLTEEQIVNSLNAHRPQ